MPFVFDDSEEAGYFYHDLTQMLNNQDVLFSRPHTAGRPSTDKGTLPTKYSARKSWAGC